MSEVDLWEGNKKAGRRTQRDDGEVAENDNLDQYKDLIWSLNYAKRIGRYCRQRI